MFNSQQPSMDDLPSSKQLVKSTIIALAVAVVILFTIVLPAEYGVDPTGIGTFLNLTKMGEIKTSLAEEAEADNSAVPAAVEPSVESTEITATVKNDVIERILEPGQAIEIKLEMIGGAVASYSWTASNGPLNFNTHGDGYKGTKQKVNYSKGRAVDSDQGEILAAFDGYHGWFWRNREEQPVKLRLETSGSYKQIKQVL